MLTLGIDYGSRYIGVSLVRNGDGTNEPLFAGTVKYETYVLNQKVGPRAQIRRIRRTRKTKKTRLRKLAQGLASAGLSQEVIPYLVNFCRRRGYKSLWDEETELEIEKEVDDEEILYRFSREVFFEALEQELESLLPSDQREVALEVCERVLNREGDRFNEIRLIRINNRGASRCAWSGCNNVTPRRRNAIKDAISQFVFTVYKSVIIENPVLQEEIENMLDRLVPLAKRYRNAAGMNKTNERKILMKRVRAELKILQDLTEKTAEGSTGVRDVKKVWDYIKKNLESIIKSQTGRNRYCREHSAKYVDFILNGKAIPFKRSLTDKDLVSRREEILFRKLWRYIEARILPLAPEGIDRIVVERTAFDLLAGTRKQRDKLGDKTIEDMYQYGPRYGFKNDLEMLKEEFGGLCAYCGKPSKNILEREHILPRASFFFDSYINIVAACRTCNSNLKGKVLPGPAELRIHNDAYNAYSEYLGTKYRNKPPHAFQTIKKGILNLMRQPDRIWEAEAYLALVAQEFAQTVQAQRGPRPLARYLCEKLRLHQKLIPDVAFYSGRHTEVWRRAAYPGFDKIADKATGGIINHALDALLLASDLPSVAALEAKHLRTRDLTNWKNEVRKRVPEAGPNGTPELPELTTTVPGFEEILPSNYVYTDIALFNWNKKNAATHKQDPFGWPECHESPSKRVQASELAADLLQIDKKNKTPQKRREVLQKTINLVVPPDLKKCLLENVEANNPGEKAAEALKNWLRKSLLNSLPKSEFSNHPGDIARKQDLEAFAQGKSKQIPAVIGIKMLFPDISGKVDLHRRDPRTGGILHRYMTDPSNISLVLAYPRDKKGQTDRKTPLLLGLRQNGAVEIKSGKRHLSPVPEGPLQGRVLGDNNNQQSRPKQAKEWNVALKTYLAGCGLAEYGLVHQGCVLRYEDGREWFLRNFSSNYGFKTSILKGVVGIRRTPLSQSFRSLMPLDINA